MEWLIGERIDRYKIDKYKIDRYKINIKTYVIHVNGPIKSNNFSTIFKN